MIGKRGQGALEYLLLLAAAIIVVAVVVSFIATTVGPVENEGTKNTYDYLCVTLNPPNPSDSCKCFLGTFDKTECCAAADTNISSDLKRYLNCS